MNQRPGIQIRSATPADAQGIGRVHVQSWRETYTGIIPDHVLAALSVDRRAMLWREAMTTLAEKSIIYVAEDPAAGVVGFCSGSPQQDQIADYDGVIDTLYLLRSHQKQGIGRQLLGTVAGQMQAMWGFQSLLVWVLSLNPTRHFYERMGGQFIVEKELEIGGATLWEVAYGWPDASVLSDQAAQPQPRNLE